MGDSESSSLTLAHTTMTSLGLETMLHMACLGSKQETMEQYLEKAKSFGESYVRVSKAYTVIGRKTDS